MGNLEIHLVEFYARCYNALKQVLTLDDINGDAGHRLNNLIDINRKNITMTTTLV